MDDFFRQHDLNYGKCNIQQGHGPTSPFDVLSAAEEGKCPLVIQAADEILCKQLTGLTVPADTEAAIFRQHGIDLFCHGTIPALKGLNARDF